MGWEWGIQCEENLSMKPTEESRSHPVKIALPFAWKQPYPWTFPSHEPINALLTHVQVVVSVCCSQMSRSTLCLMLSGLGLK